MKLLTVRVTNFCSAEDSGTFEVEQVTCLVGKNEAGKSAVLLALGALNPHPATPAALEGARLPPATPHPVRRAAPRGGRSRRHDHLAA